jgi:hypothetical protein
MKRLIALVVTVTALAAAISVAQAQARDHNVPLCPPGDYYSEAVGHCIMLDANEGSAAIVPAALALAVVSAQTQTGQHWCPPYAYYNTAVEQCVLYPTDNGGGSR